MRSEASPLTALGEDAVHRVSTRYEDFTVLDEEGASQFWPGRHTTGRRRAIRQTNAIVDIVAICENFATSRILQACPHLSQSNVSDWKRRQRTWRVELRVDFEQHGTGWGEVAGFVEVRNALQHGLGRLTERQLLRHRNSVLDGIRKAGVELNGDRVVLTSWDVARCADACIDFILYLDHAAPMT